MTHRQRVFYRNELVRWSFMVTGGFVAYTLSPFAPTGWHDTPSLLWLHRVLPWPILAAMFALYVVLLGTNRIGCVVVGDFLGLFMYLCELVALCVTAPGHPVNGLAFAAFFLACVFHGAAGRLALYDLESR